MESKWVLRSDITGVSAAGLISAPAWAAFLLWNAVIMEICKRTFLFWLKMALYISDAFLSSVSIWNLFRGIGSLSCLIDALFYLFTEWMKKLYFGPHCTRLMKSGIASQIFVTYWLWKAKACNLVLSFWTISPFAVLDSLFNFSAASEPASKFLPQNVKQQSKC